MSKAANDVQKGIKENLDSLNLATLTTEIDLIMAGPKPPLLFRQITTPNDYMDNAKSIRDIAMSKYCLSPKKMNQDEDAALRKQIAKESVDDSSKAKEYAKINLSSSRSISG